VWTLNDLNELYDQLCLQAENLMEVKKFCIKLDKVINLLISRNDDFINEIENLMDMREDMKERSR
jgi:hypothetical protein